MSCSRSQRTSSPFSRDCSSGSAQRASARPSARNCISASTTAFERRSRAVLIRILFIVHLLQSRYPRPVPTRPAQPATELTDRTRPAGRPSVEPFESGIDRSDPGTCSSAVHLRRLDEHDSPAVSRRGPICRWRSSGSRGDVAGRLTSACTRARTTAGRGRNDRIRRCACACSSFSDS